MKIRVLHVIDHLGLGGAQSALLDMVRNRNPENVDCEVAVMHGEGPFAVALEKEGIHVHRLSRKRWPPEYLVSLPQLLHSGGFDILHFHLQGSNWLAKPLAGLWTQARRISHDHTSGDIRFRGVLSLFPDGLTHLASDHVIAVSRGIQEFLTTWEAVPEDKISVVSNGIDTRRFQPATPEKRLQARQNLGLQKEDFVVGSMGRLAPEKNFSLLAEVARELPDSNFLIAGEGPEEAALKDLLGTCDPGGRVRLIGRIDDREAFYAALDAFVLPSLFEGLPMALLEAMACGLPCVASALPDISRALDHGTCGFLCNPADPETFVQALQNIRQKEDFSLRAAHEARVRCEDRYSAAQTASSIENIYREQLLFTPGKHPA